MLKRVLKVIAYIIDIALFPLRALLGLEVIIASAILLNDVSVKEAVLMYWEQLKQYPDQLVEATEIIFGEGF